MKLSDLIADLSLSVLNKVSTDADITDAYISDLLSDVMANAPEGGIWITLQTHLNIVAVASMKKIPAIILVNGRRPDDEAIAKSESEGIRILGTSEPAFEIAGKLHSILKE